MNIERDLNDQQKKAVYHYKGPALVLAGPGSGKTRVITYRAAYLIRQHNVPPESIIAVTFTNKAAQEMRDRLHRDDLLGETQGSAVRIHTFHDACAHILREYGEKIGLSPNFAIIDQDAQEEVISQCIRDFGPSISRDQVWLARDFISDAKVQLKDPTEPHETSRLKQQLEDESSIVAVDDLLEIARRYQEDLKRNGELDFDDLICKAVDLLANSQDVKEELQKQFQFLMIDEYQDINQAQYELIRLLSNPEENIMAVADDDQSIYSWRGSSPLFIDRFKEEYDPRIIQLVDNFRSKERLLRASQSLIKKNTRRSKKSSLIAVNRDTTSVIYHYDLETVEEELHLVEWLIKKLIREKHYSPNHIAIFYRRHKLAEKLEQHLLDRKIAVRRIQSGRPASDTAALLDYLRLIGWRSDLYMRRAIGFPDSIIDELTKLQLERISRIKGVKFGDLLRKIAAGEMPEVSVGPLTKKCIREFISAIDDFMGNLEDEQVSKTVKRLFDFLDSRRSPYHKEDLAVIKELSDSGGRWRAVNALYGGIQQGQSVSIVASYGIDNYCAAGIIAHVLQSYLELGERVICHFLPQTVAPGDLELGADQHKDQDEDGIIYVIIGSADNIPDEIIRRAVLIGADSEGENTSCLASLPAGEGGVVSTTALKLCQRLLSSYEPDNTEGLVVYDLETIGNDPKNAEIIEIAAKRVGSRREEDVFSHLVKPRSFIPKSSTDIHGITNADVKDEPRIEEILPSFLDFIGDNILVGHNIAEFDNVVVAGCMKTYMGISELPNVSYDTRSISERLLPRGSHKLSVLADRFGIEYGNLHRALDDAKLTEQIFRRLRREDLACAGRKSLPEVLPLIAVGILGKNAAMEEENAAFYNAALRQASNRKKTDEAVELLPILNLEAAEEEEAIGFLDMMRKGEPPDTRDDMDWNETKAMFQNIVLGFETGSYDRSLNAFLDHAALMTDDDISEESEDAVTMMTVHSAKGKEFPVVIMIGMEQGTFPLVQRNLSEEDRENELEEERRLCYVGMTRAKEQLYMISVRRRVSDWERTPSQFIWEIQPDLIETVSADQIRRAWENERQRRIKAKTGAGVENK